MSTESTTGHVNPDELFDYFEKRLTEDQEEKIEEHLAECTPCTQQARAALIFTSVWDRWTAHAHAEAHLRAALAEALEVAHKGAGAPTMRERLARWQEHWAGRAESAVRVVMGTPGAASRILTE